MPKPDPKIFLNATGEALDFLVAEHLLGYLWKRDQDYEVASGRSVGAPFRYLTAPDSIFKDVSPWDGVEEMPVSLSYCYVPRFHEDLNACFTAMQALRAKGMEWAVTSSNGVWLAGAWTWGLPKAERALVAAADLPEAICKGGLLGLFGGEVAGESEKTLAENRA